ncbi:MAG: hypothetical protein Q8O56_07425 [Solirubrobacteraceae bacterium]|nr:hypothetical protein [Solirubrobacteraceae bacterium]
MPRICEDCGIGRSELCICDERAGLDHPRNPYLERERGCPLIERDRSGDRPVDIDRQAA